MPFRHVIADDSHAKWGAKTFLSETQKKYKTGQTPFCIIKETNFQSQAPQKTESPPYQQPLQSRSAARLLNQEPGVNLR